MISTDLFLKAQNMLRESERRREARARMSSPPPRHNPQAMKHDHAATAGYGGSRSVSREKRHTKVTTTTVVRTTHHHRSTPATAEASPSSLFEDRADYYLDANDQQKSSHFSDANEETSFYTAMSHNNSNSQNHVIDDYHHDESQTLSYAGYSHHNNENINNNTNSRFADGGDDDDDGTLDEVEIPPLPMPRPTAPAPVMQTAPLSSAWQQQMTSPAFPSPTSTKAVDGPAETTSIATSPISNNSTSQSYLKQHVIASKAQRRRSDDINSPDVTPATQRRRTPRKAPTPTFATKPETSKKTKPVVEHDESASAKQRHSSSSSSPQRPKFAVSSSPIRRTASQDARQRRAEEEKLQKSKESTDLATSSSAELSRHSSSVRKAPLPAAARGVASLATLLSTPSPSTTTATTRTPNTATNTPAALSFESSAFEGKFVDPYKINFSGRGTHNSWYDASTILAGRPTSNSKSNKLQQQQPITYPRVPSTPATFENNNKAMMTQPPRHRARSSSPPTTKTSRTAPRRSSPSDAPSAGQNRPVIIANTGFGSIKMKAKGRDKTPSPPISKKRDTKCEYVVNNFSYTSKMLQEHKKKISSAAANRSRGGGSSKGTLSRSLSESKVKVARPVVPPAPPRVPAINTPNGIIQTGAVSSSPSIRVNTSSVATGITPPSSSHMSANTTGNQVIHTLITHLLVTETQHRGTYITRWGSIVKELCALPGGASALLQHLSARGPTPFRCAALTLLLNTPHLFSAVVLPAMLPGSLPTAPRSMTEEMVVALIGLQSILPDRGVLSGLLVELLDNPTSANARHSICWAIRTLGGEGPLRGIAQGHPDPDIRKHAIAALVRHTTREAGPTSCVRIIATPSKTHNKQKDILVSYKTHVEDGEMVVSDPSVSEDNALALLRGTLQLDELWLSVADGVDVAIHRIAQKQVMHNDHGPYLRPDPSSEHHADNKGDDTLTTTDHYASLANFFTQLLVSETRNDVLSQITHALASIPAGGTETAVLNLMKRHPDPHHHHIVFVLAHAVTKLGCSERLRRVVLEYLVRCISNDQLTHEVRNAAVVGIRAFGSTAFDVAAHPTLNAMHLGVVTPTVAMTTLGGMGPVAAPLIVEIALYEGHPSECRVAALHALQSCARTRSESVLALCRLLHDADPMVRAEAAGTVALVCQRDGEDDGHNTSCWIPQLHQLLADTEVCVRDAAATGLAMYGGREGHDALTDCLMCGYSADMRMAAARSMAYTGERALAPLFVALRKERCEDVQICIAETLMTLLVDDAVVSVFLNVYHQSNKKSNDPGGGVVVRECVAAKKFLLALNNKSRSGSVVDSVFRELEVAIEKFLNLIRPVEGEDVRSSSSVF